MEVTPGWFILSQADLLEGNSKINLTCQLLLRDAYSTNTIHHMVDLDLEQGGTFEVVNKKTNATFLGISGSTKPLYAASFPKTRAVYRLGLKLRERRQQFSSKQS